MSMLADFICRLVGVNWDAMPSKGFFTMLGDNDDR
ncbi:hypothetical protein Xmau_01636 [Xenorhabdus mauleonii]|uniref:Uncharacterized protein n=1 Tax=Xenorhabdus mauleonii TaxID=351675 RepID=A0A1I3P3Y7_9GAMM|nr:hypothetical protein Xmau_01636 [Xenorhabdus mauleonii]SFJ16263.1 hypothetical protein SAMN05421680_10625 [Xenorhabdus mauleonii]